MYLLKKDYVRYECTCGSLMSIADLYFCRHCLELRCGYCVYHEVDSYYCSNCLEHLPSAEARLKKNRCATCFDCPNCSHPLSVRATTRCVEDETKSTPTKRYYLACFFCRWTSRDVNIPDQTVAVGNWPVREDPNHERLSSFFEYFKIIAMLERSQKETKPYSSIRKGYSSLTDKYGLTAMMARKRAGLPSLQLTGKDYNTNVMIPTIKPYVAVPNIDPLPDSYYTEAPDLTKVTTLEQRHANPMLQSEHTNMLHPQHRHFYVKRSLRCRKCEHNVSKPEYNPGSIKFKIQLAAYYHMPEVRIMTFEPLIRGKPSEIIVKVTNPTQHLTSLTFGDLLDNDEAEQKSETDGEKDPMGIGVAKLKHSLVTNSKVVLPSRPVILPPRDDAAEFDDTGDTHNFDDDPKIVVWRKGNKAAIKFKIIPEQSVAQDEVIIFGFSLEYGYVNTMPALEQRQPQRTDMQVNVYLNPGKVSLGADLHDSSSC